MLTVVTHIWRQPSGYHTEFRPEHANALFRAVGKHYPSPFRFVVRTDGTYDRAEFDRGIEYTWDLFGDELGRLPNPSLRRGPSCYRRLRLFDPSCQADLGLAPGDRLVALDLDTLVVGDLAPLWGRPEDLVLWRDPLFEQSRPRLRYNGSMLLLRAGTNADVWRDFDPETSPAEARRAGFLGSDQAWLSHKLGDDQATWGREDGVYSFRLMTEERLHSRVYADPLPDRGRLPEGARVVFFHGRNNPWDPEVLAKYPWAREYYLG